MPRLLPFVFLLVLGACAADSGWRHPSLPESRWDQDLTACRRAADDAISPVGYNDPDDRSMLPGRLLDRADTQRSFDRYVASCMTGKGYRQEAR